ncbi:hypothetical protein AMTRI_Chr02g216370 [Amborella trichopoda]
MAPRTFFLPFLSLCLIAHLHGTMSAEPLYHICSSTPTYHTTYTSFHHSLSPLLHLLHTLAAKTSITGFATASSPDHHLHGLALCRGDVMRQDCKACVENATIEISHLCPGKEEAIVWFDNCLLRYSDKDFIGEVDESNKFYMWNIYNISQRQVFNRHLGELMYELSSKASSSHFFFATGEVEVIREKTMIYGLTQCSNDLSSGDCKACLDEVIGELPTCCSGKQGGRVLTESCSIRYEVYPFYRT